ncbi:MAG: hypothetical protein ACI85Q_001489 [Salibacteraceae bacterium]|jgi:hypothetical protein
MKKITLLFVFVIFSLFADAQAKKQVSFGLIGASYEIPVSEAITIAPTAFTNFDLNYIVLGVKANFYLDDLIDLPSAWDVYGGANLGFGLAISDKYSSDLNLGLQIGGRWFWSDKWGVYLEGGGGSLGGDVLGTYGAGLTMVL